jgi:8-oxo-dGTP diphosphatase
VDLAQQVNKMTEEKQTKVSIAVLILDIENKRFLMGKRKNVRGDGLWAFPGGHLEFKESFEDAAKREVKEETGLDIELIDKNHSWITSYDIFPNDNKHYIVLFMRAKYIGGEARIMETEKCEELKWVSLDSLPSPLFPPIKRLFEVGNNPFG